MSELVKIGVEERRGSYAVKCGRAKVIDEELQVKDS